MGTSTRWYSICGAVAQPVKHESVTTSNSHSIVTAIGNANTLDNHFLMDDIGSLCSSDSSRFCGIGNLLFALYGGVLHRQLPVQRRDVSNLRCDFRLVH